MKLFEKHLMDKIEQTQNPKKKERNWWSIPHPLRELIFGWRIHCRKGKETTSWPWRGERLALKGCGQVS
jgi:hypothetical protein